MNRFLSCNQRRHNFKGEVPEKFSVSQHIFMQIRLQKLVPIYFEQDKITNSQVWAQEVILTKGEHTHIIAASGRGKTSLIHFIYGLRKDYEGNVYYGDENIDSLSREKFSLLRQKNVSIVFQDLRLFSNQT